MAQEELAELVGYRVKETQALLRSHMEDALRPLGLTAPQYACLELLGRTPGASNADLARGAFVTRQTMNTIVQGLQDRGLIDRAIRAPKGRALPTALTPVGKRSLAEAKKRIQTIESKMVSQLNQKQCRELQTLLGLCIRGLQK